jgi:hypothetical protein
MSLRRLARPERRPLLRAAGSNAFGRLELQDFSVDPKDAADA